MFFDCRIDQRLTQQASESGNIKAFFNRRFHDKGVHWQRLVYFQTISTKRDGGKRKRGLANLHVHALFILPERQTLKQIRASLAEIFGRVPGMGDIIQFKHTKPDWTKRCDFNGITAQGPLGKILYIQQGMGGTYNDLAFNENGKRSRKAPIERLRCNKRATGLARGIPSHFNAKAALCDHVSTRAGELAFQAWLAEGREQRREEKRRQIREKRLAAKNKTPPPSRKANLLA